MIPGGYRIDAGRPRPRETAARYPKDPRSQSTAEIAESLDASFWPSGEMARGEIGNRWGGDSHTRRPVATSQTQMVYGGPPSLSSAPSDPAASNRPLARNPVVNQLRTFGILGAVNTSVSCRPSASPT